MLKNNDFRVHIDERDEKLGYKVRESVMKKIPYSIIIGQKEVDNRNISYRKYGTEETITVSIDEFIKLINDKIDSKEI